LATTVDQDLDHLSEIRDEQMATFRKQSLPEGTNTTKDIKSINQLVKMNTGNVKQFDELSKELTYELMQDIHDIQEGNIFDNRGE
jgi:hypothetical protein